MNKGWKMKVNFLCVHEGVHCNFKLDGLKKIWSIYGDKMMISCVRQIKILRDWWFTTTKSACLSTFVFMHVLAFQAYVQFLWLLLHDKSCWVM